MPGDLRYLTLDCSDSARLAAFWSAALGWPILADEEWGAVVGGSEPGRPGLYLQPVPEPKVGKNRMHLDIWTADYEPERDRLIGLGATEVRRATSDDGRPFSVMADPEGNEFCVAVPR